MHFYQKHPISIVFYLVVYLILITFAVQRER